jgi:hypothetical protein
LLCRISLPPSVRTGRSILHFCLWVPHPLYMKHLLRLALFCIFISDGFPLGTGRRRAPVLGSSAIAMSDFPLVNFVKRPIDERKGSREVTQFNRGDMSRCCVRFIGIVVSFLSIFLSALGHRASFHKIIYTTNGGRTRGK